jgi:CheY-like chemotaxis protein
MEPWWFCGIAVSGPKADTHMIPKRILVADDSDTVRRVICTCLTEQFTVCGDAVDGQDVIEKAWKLKPDLVLMDLAMPRTNGIVAASVLKDMMPNVRIVLFTMYSKAVRRTFSPKGIAVDAVIDKADGLIGLLDCIQSLLPA